jgi:uncharacterized membrane protein YdjX (TVP38/TMEM64 family)
VQRPPSGAPGRRSALVRLAALGLGIAVAVAVVLFVVRPTPGAMRDATADVRDWADSIGPLAPLLFVAVSASLTTLMFPGPLLAGASGLLFGVALGFPVSLASAVLGACLAFLISRYLGAMRSSIWRARGCSRSRSWSAGAASCPSSTRASPRACRTRSSTTPRA